MFMIEMPHGQENVSEPAEIVRCLARDGAVAFGEIACGGPCTFTQRKNGFGAILEESGRCAQDERRKALEAGAFSPREFDDTPESPLSDDDIARCGRLIAERAREGDEVATALLKMGRNVCTLCDLPFYVSGGSNGKIAAVPSPEAIDSGKECKTRGVTPL